KESEVRNNLRTDRNCSRKELAGARRRRRHRTHVSHAQALPNTFVIAEKERPLTFEGPAKGASELIPSEWWRGDAIKKVACIQSVIAEELIDRAVHLVLS